MNTDKINRTGPYSKAAKAGNHMTPRPICHGFITRDNISYIFEIYSAHDGEPEDFAIYTERQDGSKGPSLDPDPFLTDIQLAYQAHIENESLRD